MNIKDFEEQKIYELKAAREAVQLANAAFRRNDEKSALAAIDAALKALGTGEK